MISHENLALEGYENKVRCQENREKGNGSYYYKLAVAVKLLLLQAHFCWGGSFGPFVYKLLHKVEFFLNFLQISKMPQSVESKTGKLNLSLLGIISHMRISVIKKICFF